LCYGGKCSRYHKCIYLSMQASTGSSLRISKSTVRVFFYYFCKIRMNPLRHECDFFKVCHFVNVITRVDALLFYIIHCMHNIFFSSLTTKHVPFWFCAFLKMSVPEVRLARKCAFPGSAPVPEVRCMH